MKACANEGDVIRWDASAESACRPPARTAHPLFWGGHAHLRPFATHAFLPPGCARLHHSTYHETSERGRRKTISKSRTESKKQKRPGAEGHAKGVRGWAFPPRTPCMTGFGARALRNAGSFCRSAERRDEQRHLACRYPQNAASSLLPSAERSIEPASAERQH